MNLDDILNEKFTQRTRKPKPAKRPPTKEQIEIKKAKECVKLLKTGDFNKGNKYHLMDYYAAVKLGYIEKGTCKILID